uniref:Uncharacterized protein n=1 Tax=Amphimedon queenslandica TaxID=400682 RepID=A0A1X7SIS3_AMPQE
MYLLNDCMASVIYLLSKLSQFYMHCLSFSFYFYFIRHIHCTIACSYFVTITSNHFSLSDRVTNGSCPANATSILVLNDGTINVPLTKPVCIRCRFISNQGDFISFSDGVWRKGSTVLSDGDFSGNVIISNTSNTLFLTLVHPATVVDVGDTLTCSSFSADQQSVITIGAFNFLNPRVSPNGT